MKSFQYQLSQVVKFLEKARVDYAVLGGIAVSIYSEPRMTQDIDLNIALNMEDLSQFLGKAREYGFQPIPPGIKKFAEETGVIPMKFLKRGVAGRVDFIIAQNPIEFAGLKRARLRSIWGVKVKIVTAEDLLVHKLLSDRPRDLEDARGIVLRQGERLDKKYVMCWLRKMDKLSPRPYLIKQYKEMIS
jgi:hypothetical protein